MRAGRKIFQDRLGVQIAWFLKHFIENEHTPAVTADRTAGGIILMGWSFGNATNLSLLADPTTIPRSVYEIIEPHLRSLVLYGADFDLLTEK